MPDVSVRPNVSDVLVPMFCASVSVWFAEAVWVSFDDDVSVKDVFWPIPELVVSVWLTPWARVSECPVVFVAFKPSDDDVPAACEAFIPELSDVPDVAVSVRPWDVPEVSP